jgi:hypothetical protein
MININNFKKTCLIIMIANLLLSFNSYCQKTHIGNWKGVDKGKIGFINLQENGFATITSDNCNLGGETFRMNGVDLKLTYSIDYKSSPINIDFIITSLNNNEELNRLSGIIEFIGETKMKIRFSFEKSSRPINFLPEGNDDTVILEKVN